MYLAGWISCFRRDWQIVFETLILQPEFLILNFHYT